MKLRIALLLLLAAVPAAAQREVIRTPVAGEGCQGFALRSTLGPMGPVEYPVITGVRAGYPAALAGLQVGDTVVSRDGHDAVAEHDAVSGPPAPGDSVVFVVRRAGQSVRVRVIVGELRPGPDGQLVCVPHSGPPSREE